MIKNNAKFNKRVGAQIRAIRKAKGLSQEDLAKKMYLTRVSIVNIEAGRQAPTFLWICQLAEFFKVPIGYFKGDRAEIEVQVTRKIRI